MVRKKWIGLAALPLAALLLAGITIAYLTDMRRSENRMGIGGDEAGNRAVLLSLEEPSFARNAHETRWLLSNPDNELTHASLQNLEPGQRIYKDPTITNEGTSDIYLRIKTDTTAGLWQTLTEDFGLQVNPDFTPGGDGYYYYTGEGSTPEILKPGQSVLFFLVTPGANGNYSMAVPKTWKRLQIDTFLAAHKNAENTFAFTITAEAVQAANYEAAIPWVGVTPEAVATSKRVPG